MMPELVNQICEAFPSVSKDYLRVGLLAVFSREAIDENTTVEFATNPNLPEIEMVFSDMTIVFKGEYSKDENVIYINDIASYPSRITKFWGN